MDEWLDLSIRNRFRVDGWPSRSFLGGSDGLISCGGETPGVIRY